MANLSPGERDGAGVLWIPAAGITPGSVTSGEIMLFGVFAIVALFALVAAKYLTSVRLQNMRKHVVQAEVAARSARGKLKAVEHDSGFAGREVKAKQRKRQTLERQIEKYKKDLAELK